MPTKVEVMHFFVIGKDEGQSRPIRVALHKSTAVKCMRSNSLVKIEDKAELRSCSPEQYKSITGGMKEPGTGDIIIVARKTVTRIQKARVRIPKAAKPLAKPAVKKAKRVVKVAKVAEEAPKSTQEQL